MKRIFYSMTILLALASCSKENENPEDNNLTGKTTITISTGLDESDITSTKTTQESAVFSWTSGETISVGTSDDEFVSFECTDASKGLFSHTFGGVVPTLKAAISPVRNPSDSFTDDDDPLFEITLPDSYDYVEGVTNAVLVAGEPVLTDGKYKFVFHHAAALMKITYENVPVGTTGFVFSLADGDTKKITGTVTLASSAYEIKNDDSDLDGKTVTINLPDAVSTLNSAYSFYVPLPTGDYAAGINFYLKNATGKITASEKTTLKALSLTRGDVFKAKTITLTPEVSAARGTKLYAEGWDNYSNGATPSSTSTDAFVYNNGTVTYTWSNTSDAKVQTGTMYADGTDAPEVIIKGGASLTIGNIPTGLNKKITLRFKSNKGITLSSSLDGVTIADLSKTDNSYETVITLDRFYTVIDLEFSRGAAEDNTRIDDISLYAGEPLTDPGLVFPDASYTAIKELGFIAPALTNPNSLTVSYVSTDTNVATVNSSTGEVTLKAAGETTIKAVYPGDGENYMPSTVSYDLTVENASLSLSSETTPAKAESAVNSTVTFTVTSNVDWTAAASSDPNNIVKSIAASEGTVTVTFNANTVATEKTAIVTVTPDADALSTLVKSITVTQKAFENVDILTRAWTGIDNGTTSYTNWSNKVGSTTGNKYSGKSAGGYNSIQLRTSGSDEGIISTTTNGSTIQKVVVTWASQTTKDRELEIYGKNSAYSATTDLYGENKGTLLGTLTRTENGTTQTVELSESTISEKGDFSYIGIRSKSSAQYLSEIRIYWATVTKYNITIADGIANGSVEANVSSATEGTTVTLTPTPASGYAFDSWDVYKTGDTSTKVTVTSNQFTMPDYDVTVSASFVAVPTISMNTTNISSVVAAGISTTASNAYSLVNGATNGDVTITCDGTIVTTATKSATAGSIDYTVATNTAAAREGWIKVKYNTEEAHEITVNQLAKKYTLSIAAVDNGTVSATVGGNTIEEGENLLVDCGATVTVTESAASGYELSTLVYNDGSNNDIKASKSFTMPAANTTVTGIYAVATGGSYTITFGNNANSATGLAASTKASTVISEGTEYVTTSPFTVNSGNIYYGDTKTCIRIGKSKSSSSLSIALSNTGKVKAKTIIVNCKNMGGNNSGATLSVNSATAQTTSDSEATDYTFTINSDITSITLAGSKAIYVYSIKVNY